jgi:hypothetical protein
VSDGIPSVDRQRQLFRAAWNIHSSLLAQVQKAWNGAIARATTESHPSSINAAAALVLLVPRLSNGRTGLILWTFHGTSIRGEGGSTAAPNVHMVNRREVVANLRGSRREMPPLGDIVVGFAPPPK